MSLILVVVTNYKLDGYCATDITKPSLTNDSEIESDIIRDMNVAFLCDLDDAHYLHCMLMLNSVYSDVIMKLTGDDNNNEINNNFCHKSSCYSSDKEELNFTTGDELLNLEIIITQNFSINSTCPSDDHDIIISMLMLQIFVPIAINFLSYYA